MTQALEIVNRYYEATNSKKDPDAAGALMAEGFLFIGPLMRVEGRDANVDLLRQFLPAHVETRMQKQFVDGDEVCSIYDLVVASPSGEAITMPMADWIRVEDGRVANQTIYYDPREFARAFGM